LLLQLLLSIDRRADTLPLFHFYPYVLCGQEAAILIHFGSENVCVSKSRAQPHKFIAYLKAILFYRVLWLFCHYENASHGLFLFRAGGKTQLKIARMVRQNHEGNAKEEENGYVVFI
jgi:hypothetical protein